MTFNDFLFILRGPGINAAVGVLVSILVEYLPQWQTWDAKTKRPVVLLLCLLVPLLASCGLALTGQLPVADIETWWAALLAGATAFSTSQLAHLRKLA